MHDVRAALSDLPEMSMRFLDSMNDHLLASRGNRRTNWERHFGSDEMIYVMDGETDIVTLTDGGPVSLRFMQARCLSAPKDCGIA